MRRLWTSMLRSMLPRRMPAAMLGALAGDSGIRSCRHKWLRSRCRGEPVSPPVEHISQRSSQVNFRRPTTAMPELADVAGDDRFIAAAQQRRILFYREGYLHEGANGLDHFLN